MARARAPASREYTDAETGFVYLRARYYDPATGQFLTRDPIEAQTREPYGYVGGNPLNATDPTGHNKCELGANPLRWGGNAQDCASDAAGAIADIDIGAPDVGRAVASVVNVTYGTYKFGTGVVILAGGSVATATIPVVGQIVGPPAIAFGVYQVTTGAARVTRGVRQAMDPCAEPLPEGSTIGANLNRFVRGVGPRWSGSLWDRLGGMA